MKKIIITAALLLGAVCSPAYAQVITGSLSGTVQDSTGAVVRDATITLTDTLSGSVRTLKSNGSGVFTFAGINTGDYSITITAPNFSAFTENGIHLDPGDSRKLPSLVLKAGKVDETVTVSADVNGVSLDTGERSDLITAEQIKHLSVEGRDVTELFKTLPGFAITGQGVNNSSYDPSQVSITGALGNYSANGNPMTGIYLTIDGADITDPGNYGSALQNVNYDQVGEVKVSVSNFGAEVAAGPVLVQAVTKAGGDHFHGSLYAYARTSKLNSVDALSKSANLGKAPDQQVYPGFTIGGPVLIPGTSFNHNRKFTFFAGAEDYAQRNNYAYGSASGALVQALVPTSGMRGGNFSAAELQKYLGPDLYSSGAYANISTVPTVAKDGTTIVGGIIPTAYRDPGFQAIWNSMPLPNTTPSFASPYNWKQINYINNDLYEITGRGDIAISEREHFFGRYTVERGNAGVPGVPYYNQGELNVPGGGLSTINSQSASANLTTIFSSTATNQIFGNLTFVAQNFTSGNVSALTAYPYQGAFNNGRHPLPELGNYYDAGGLPRALNPDYSLTPILNHKLLPMGGDTFTKVWGKHTATFGIFLERVNSNGRQPFVPTNGALSQYYLPGAGQTVYDVDGTTGIMSGNWAANNYQGYVSGYQQQNNIPATNLYFWTNAFFANDSWRITPRLTVNYGLRVHHLGLWNDTYGVGVAVFRPSLIKSAASVSPFPGFLWHAYDNSLPTSGNDSYPAFLEPRFGAAWDIFGNGQSVLRGGWGAYRSHDSAFAAGYAVQQGQFAQVVNYGGGGLSLKGVSNLKLNPNVTPAKTNTIGVSTAPGAAPGTPSGSPAGTYYGLTDGDREQPETDTYSVTFNQQLPGRMNLLLGYVGNNSRFLINDGSNQTVSLSNVNAIPIGGLYKPNPFDGTVLTPATANSATTSTINQYRPLSTNLVQYGTVNVPNHVLFANYNALQAGLTRQSGHVMFNINYTWGHALGINGAEATGEPADPFNVWNNYGSESFDRRHIFNASYTFMVGQPVKNRLVGAITNGWEVSGITTFQTGPNMSAVTSNPGFGLTGHIGPAGPSQISISNLTYLGTPDVSLQPTLLCDPSANRKLPNQYINGACFGTPQLGHNGVYRLPFIAAPAYFNSDLSAQKSFTFHHDQSVQFRLSAFNFLNHPLHSFTGNYPAEYGLDLTNLAGTTYTQGSLDQSLGFGLAPYTTGRRIGEVSIKYTF